MEQQQKLDALAEEFNNAVNDVDAALEADEKRQLEVGAQVEGLVERYRAFVASLPEPERPPAERRLDRKVMDLRRAAARLAQRPRGNTTELASDAGSVPFLLSRAPGRFIGVERGAPSGQISVGADVEAWCGKCKEMRTHRVVAMVGGEAKQVICESCNSKHSFRNSPPTRGRAAAAPVTSAAEVTRVEREREQDRLREERKRLQAELAAAAARPFDPRGRYKAGEIIEHPELGRGKIESVLRSSMLVRFAEGLRPVNLA